MDMSNINWLAVVVAAIANMAAGFVWYSKPAFLMPWLRGIGKTEEFTQTAKPVNFVYLFVGSIVEAIFVSFLLAAMGSMTLTSGLTAGFMIWLGFVATTSFADNLMEQRSFGLWLVQSGYHLFSLLIMGAILSAWH